MAQLTKMEEMDYRKFYLEKGDPGFNPDRNRWVVENSIRKADAMRERKRKEFIDEYMERADAIVTYLKAIDRGKVHTNIVDFFGKHNLAHLNGEDKRKELKDKIKEGIMLAKKRAALRQKHFV